MNGVVPHARMQQIFTKLNIFNQRNEIEQVLDNFEYWLMDAKDERPLVILKSAINYPEKSSTDYKQWKTGLTGFNSHKQPLNTELLEKQIKDRAAYKHICRWIEGDTNGKGIDIESGNDFSMDDFSVFLIREDWQTVECLKRVSDSFLWMPPILLTFQHLKRNTRTQIERKISVQAHSVLDNYRLFPEIVNSKLINSALVQCQLQDANINSYRDGVLG